MKYLEFKYLIGVSVLALISLMNSCGGYNKILKSTDNELRYNAAVKYYEKKDYGRSSDLFAELLVPFEGTKRDDTVNFYYAKAKYKQGELDLADYQLGVFCRTFARSPFAEEAYYLRAINLEKMSPRPDLDQSNTMRAIDAFEDFHRLYPNSTYKTSVGGLVELKDKLEEKAFNSARLYYQIENYKAAIIALQNSVKDYPLSKHNEEQMFLILKSSYLYAKNSVKRKQATRYIAAIDEYYNFVSEFPTSHYKGEAEDMYAEALKYTQKRGIQVESETPKTNETENN